RGLLHPVALGRCARMLDIHRCPVASELEAVGLTILVRRCAVDEQPNLSVPRHIDHALAGELRGELRAVRHDPDPGKIEEILLRPGLTVLLTHERRYTSIGQWKRDEDTPVWQDGVDNPGPRGTPSGGSGQRYVLAGSLHANDGCGDTLLRGRRREKCCKKRHAEAQWKRRYFHLRPGSHLAITTLLGVAPAWQGLAGQ